MILKNFIVFEGVDGSGTSTQLRLLSERRSRGDCPFPLEVTFEPTAGPIGTLLRSGLSGTERLAPSTLAHLFAADRSEHLNAPGGILELCTKGTHVVCDRYVLSSLVYQGLECGEELPVRLNRDFPRPELLFFLDLDVSIAEKRYSARAHRDLYEKIDFQRRIRERYLAMVEAYCAEGTRLVRIDAARSIEEVAQEIWSAIQNLPIL